MNAYLALTKPRLLPLVLFSGLPALVMAEGRWPSLRLAAWTLFGTALAAGAANALNSYLERERDARMARTATRPLPAGTLRPEYALWLGLGAVGARHRRAVGSPRVLRPRGSRSPRSSSTCSCTRSG